MNDREIDYIEELFESITNDPTMPAELKISLMRLQLPIHTLSQVDPNFISSDDHPAKCTLFIAKRLSHYAKVDNSLITTINLIISDLVKSKPTSASFASTNQRLESLAQNLESPDNEQNSPSPNSNDQLKQYLNHKIKLCLRGHQIPNECKTLVLKLWPNALFILIKTHGENSPHWVNAIETYCELLTSIQPVLNIEQYRELNDKFSSLVHNNNNTLLLYHQKHNVEPAIESLFNYYNHLLGNEVQNNSSTEDTRTVLEKISSLPEIIKPGVWCEIYIDDVTPPRRLKLSLIHIETGMLIFVNRKGIKKIIKDAYEFSQELKKGLSRAYKHEEIFTNTLVKETYKKIG